jgi:sugar lactone lactonase YvrE
VGEPLDALAWDGAGQHLYGVARESGTIVVMQPGRLGGLCVDAQGGVWIALQDGWSVVRFSTDGNQDRVIGLPVPSPTDLAFGGSAQDTLYVTSARQSVPVEALGNAPLPGRLFELRQP